VSSGHLAFQELADIFLNLNDWNPSSTANLDALDFVFPDQLPGSGLANESIAATSITVINTGSFGASERMSLFILTLSP
jgi:hypothetical protein